MIHTRRITNTLTFLDGQYNAHVLHRDTEIPVLYAKMAILEYCGWLELTFDEIARNCVRRKLRTVSSRQLLEEKISKTHGFTYENNVRPLLVYGLGTIKLLQVERKLDATGDLQALKSHLGSINKRRREAAHTFTSGRTSRFDAPSATISNLKRVEPTLQKLWKLVCED